MKLPDFTDDTAWNKLRNHMKAEWHPFETTKWVATNTDNLEQKLKSTGVEVNFDEIEIDDDGSFNFQGRKVLIYIRDQRFSNKFTAQYRFHLCNCKTIEEFKSRNQLERYVVSRRTDGIFLVNEFDSITRTYKSKGQYKKMDVCKNCLLHLSYNGYSDHRADYSIFKTFQLGEFFEAYRAPQFHTIPKHYADNGPLDDYTSDFDAKSKAYRESIGWKCERCNLDLNMDKIFLHVHHKNGIKHDNSNANYEGLCLGCHAEVDGHIRMKFSNDYAKFMAKYKTEWVKHVSYLNF